jgi:hypothetical protein
MGDLVEACGIWCKQTKRGADYFSGTIDGRRFLIFVNARRKSDKAPTHTMFWADQQDGDTMQASLSSHGKGPRSRPEGYGGHDGFPDTRPADDRWDDGHAAAPAAGRRGKVQIPDPDEVPF